MTLKAPRAVGTPKAVGRGGFGNRGSGPKHRFYPVLAGLVVFLALAVGMAPFFVTRAEEDLPFNVNVIYVGSCGNGSVEISNVEKCDDGNVNQGDGCSQYCRVETGFYCEGSPSVCYSVCSDGIKASNEACDDGNLVLNDGCNDQCVREVCGDGILHIPLGEQCDDGNLLSNDGCNSQCVIEICGDGVIQRGIGETCDDGGTANNDGCDNLCHREICGNGFVQVHIGEGCDDKGLCSGDNRTPCTTFADCTLVGGSCTTRSNDGCSSICLPEPGYACSGEPSCCSICGDGVISCAEGCDDGKECSNTNPCTTDAECLGIGDNLCKPRGADGCSELCVVEQQATQRQAVVISEVIAFPGQRSGSAGTNYDTDLTFSILSNDGLVTRYKNSFIVSSNNAGSAFLQVEPGLEQGNYKASIKTEQHLSKLLSGVYLQNGSNILNFTNLVNSVSIGSEKLTPGDINLAGNSAYSLGDDVVNSVDLAILLSKMGQTDPTGNIQRANLNQDGVVDALDLNILLGNLGKIGQERQLQQPQ